MTYSFYMITASVMKGLKYVWGLTVELYLKLSRSTSFGTSFIQIQLAAIENIFSIA